MKFYKLTDPLFRAKLGTLTGMVMNFLYVIFRAVTGILYKSVWFVAMAVYHLTLGVTRAGLIIGREREIIRYRRTALTLFIINIPMGIMIALMIKTNSGFSYPGYVIYLSAAYTFWSFFKAVSGLIRFRRIGSPALSAAKVIDFVAAMMSLLGLQTAMIGRFSTDGEGFRRLMNTITGSAIYVFVILIAIYMLVKSKRRK